MRLNLLAIAIAIGSFAIVGCSEKAAPTKTKADPKADNHDEEHVHGEGPNGGTIFDLGRYHGEFKVDHTTKSCMVFIIKGDTKDATPLAVAATELMLTTKETKTKDGKVVPAMTVKLLPKDMKDGKASVYVGTDPNFATEVGFEGTIAGEIDGRVAEGNFAETEH